MYQNAEDFYRSIMFIYLSIGSDEFYFGDYYNAKHNLNEAVNYFKRYFELNQKDRKHDQYHLDRALKLLKEIDDKEQRNKLYYQKVFTF